MSPPQGKKEEVRKKAFGKRAFFGVTAMSIVIAALLVTLSCISSNEEVITSSTEPPNGSKTTTPSIVVSGTSIGSPYALITIVIYSDFQCFHCQRFALTVEKQLDSAYVETGKVRFIYKHIVAYGPESLLAAEASECAAEQNQFWPYHYALMELRLSSQSDDLSIEKLQSLAQQLGLDMIAFNTSLESGKYQEKVLRDDAEGRGLGLTSVPAFFINGVKADDSVAGSFEAFQKVLDEELIRLGQ
jgi:protein-disulfide isomerase